MYPETPKPLHPGQVLKSDYLEPLSLSVTAVADWLGISRNTISGIVNATGGVTPDMALRLAKAFGPPPEYWLELQRNYDLWHAQQKNSGWQDVEPIENIRAGTVWGRQVLFPPGGVVVVQKTQAGRKA